MPVLTLLNNDLVLQLSEWLERELLKRIGSASKDSLIEVNKEMLQFESGLVNYDKSKKKIIVIIDYVLRICVNRGIVILFVLPRVGSALTDNKHCASRNDTTNQCLRSFLFAVEEVVGCKRRKAKRN